MEIYFEGEGAREVRDNRGKERKKREYKLLCNKDLQSKYVNMMEQRAMGGEINLELELQARWERLTGSIWEVGREFGCRKEKCGQH